MKQCPQPSSSQAFTLIELLAVVAIILILLSLLVPTLSGARERAEFAVCKSNLRQIGIAANMHAGDKDGEWPDCWQWMWSTGEKTGSLWIEWTIPGKVEKGTLTPYLGKSQTSVLVCPTFKKVYKFNESLPADAQVYVSYDMNEYFRTNHLYGSTIQGWAGHPAIHRQDMITPATEGVFCEEDPWPNKYDTGYMNNMCFGTGADALGSFHVAPTNDLLEGFSNVWFADGHVEKCHPRDSTSIMTPECVKRKIK